MTLPVFKVERVEIDAEDGTHSRYDVTCPRRECRGNFWVPLSWAVIRMVEGANGQMTITIGRPCPHCSKVAEIPQEIRQAPKRRRTARTVKRRKKS